MESRQLILSPYSRTCKDDAANLTSHPTAQEHDIDLITGSAMWPEDTGIGKREPTALAWFSHRLSTIFGFRGLAVPSLTESLTDNPSTPTRLEHQMDKPSSDRKRRYQWDSCVRSDACGSPLNPFAILEIAKDIFDEISRIDPIDDIHECGTASIVLLGRCSQEALDLAHTKLHTWPYHELPRCWRRLYEDASLFVVAEMLKSLSDGKPGPDPPILKRFKPSGPHRVADVLGPIVSLLDKAIIVAGAPTRRSYIESILSRLGQIFDATHGNSVASSKLPIIVPELRLFGDQVLRTTAPLSLQQFEKHLSKSRSPIVMPETFQHWPALQNWSDLSYLKRATLNGNRLVPIEVGDTYTDEAWTQQLIPFSEFVEKYLLPEDPVDTGYLAQHDLFEHLSILRKDINIPDYCYIEPPQPCGAALLTAGLADTLPLDTPLLNAWLGPKGTKTPLHTDPYHNMLCQVVGYKYVRLYSPEETSRLYPRSTNESGINMANTTRLDADHFRPSSDRGQQVVHSDQDIMNEFPLFTQAKYEESILAPGQCLYIPLGWWHYVESLTPSFSVSFWWN